MNKNLSTAALTLALIACCYFGVFHSHRYFGFDLVLCVGVCGVFSIIGLDYLHFGMNNSQWQKFRTLTILIFIGIPITVVVIVLHQYYIDMHLSDYGKKTHGVVTRLYNKKHKYSRTYYAEFEYSFVGKTWTQTLRNDDHKFSVGDTIELRCSTQDPEAFELLQDTN